MIYLEMLEEAYIVSRYLPSIYTLEEFEGVGEPFEVHVVNRGWRDKLRADWFPLI